MTDTGWGIVAVLASGIAVAGLVGLVVRPTVRLAPRLRPYSIPSRVTLGRVHDLSPSPASGLFGPMVGRAAERLGRLVDGGGDEAMVLKLRQAGLLVGVDPADRLAEYRMRQLGNVVAFTLAATGIGIILAVEPLLVVVLAAAGFVVGVTRWRGRLDRRIEERKRRMQIEIYTIDQLLALQTRAGAGVVRSVSRITERGSGGVVEELAEALRLHRSGLSAAESFRSMARFTPEPHCRRTYSLLATAEERGADLAAALLALAEDVREQRRHEIQRRATRSRAAMLVPVIAILAPVMLLFVAAPLPQIIFGIR